MCLDRDNILLQSFASVVADQSTHRVCEVHCSPTIRSLLAVYCYKRHPTDVALVGSALVAHGSISTAGAANDL